MTGCCWQSPAIFKDIWLAVVGEDLPFLRIYIYGWLLLVKSCIFKDIWLAVVGEDLPFLRIFIYGWLLLAKSCHAKHL